ncbi:MAG: hypothetical protein ABSF14_20640 [Terriglobia bacterium]|jgi:hypothetical protein
MKRNLWALVVLAWVITAGLAAAADRWVHVRVIENGEDGERVRINIPLSLAEKVLPTIKADKLRDGKIQVDDLTTDKVDLRALLEAVRDAQDNEYVTVDSRHETIRVAKSGGFMLIKVQEGQAEGGKTPHDSARKHSSNVDIKIPFPVVEALLSGGKDEINVLAALRALGNYQNIDLVTVNDADSTVRIWVDSSNVAD